MAIVNTIPAADRVDDSHGGDEKDGLQPMNQDNSRLSGRDVGGGDFDFASDSVMRRLLCRSHARSLAGEKG